MIYELLYSEMVDEIKSVSAALIIKNDFFIRDEILPGFLEKNKSFENLRNELRVLNDNFFSWTYKNTNNKEWLPMGEFHFIAIEEVMQESKNDVLFNREAKNNINEDIYPFDDHPHGGDGLMTCFAIQNENVRITLFSENGQIFPMSLGLQEYLLKTIEFKALYGWQYLFAEIDLNKPFFSIVKKDLNKRLEILQQLFPNRMYNQYFIK
jgi:hypothetical protein